MSCAAIKKVASFTSCPLVCLFLLQGSVRTVKKKKKKDVKTQTKHCVNEEQQSSPPFPWKMWPLYSFVLMLLLRREGIEGGEKISMKKRILRDLQVHMAKIKP